MHAFGSRIRYEFVESRGGGVRNFGLGPKLTYTGEFMIRENLRWMAALTLAANLAFAPAALMAAPRNGDKNASTNATSSGPATTTPIKHVVVIFQENISFDHYFATYPVAANSTAGEPKFQRQSLTRPSVNGLTEGLLTTIRTPTQPFRLDPRTDYTCDQNHDYTPSNRPSTAA